MQKSCWWHNYSLLQLKDLSPFSKSHQSLFIQKSKMPPHAIHPEQVSSVSFPNVDKVNQTFFFTGRRKRNLYAVLIRIHPKVCELAILISARSLTFLERLRLVMLSQLYLSAHMPSGLQISIWHSIQKPTRPTICWSTFYCCTNEKCSYTVVPINQGMRMFFFPSGA